MADGRIVTVLTGHNGRSNEAVLRAACLMAGDLDVSMTYEGGGQPSTEVLWRGGYSARLEGNTMYVQCPTAAAAAALAAMLAQCSAYGFDSVAVVQATYLRVVLDERNHGAPEQEVVVYMGPYTSVQEARDRAHSFTYVGNSLAPTVAGCAITDIVQGLPHAPAFVHDDNCDEQVLGTRIAITCERLLFPA